MSHCLRGADLGYHFLIRRDLLSASIRAADFQCLTWELRNLFSEGRLPAEDCPGISPRRGIGGRHNNGDRSSGAYLCGRARRSSSVLLGGDRYNVLGLLSPIDLRPAPSGRR